ncbi:MAG: hypothetical protein KGL54_06680 [Sphingomonadales bacterium]|nr:hypothetical protein [Sphingomonadales bacterium]
MAPPVPPSFPAAPPPAGEPGLGALSARYESGGRGPGTVSSGQGDPGGVSYGLYQLASGTGALAAFLAGEGARWATELGAAAPGSAGFTACWQAIARREPEAFAAAQHGFIARTHYAPLAAALRARTGLDLARHSAALRAVCWSCAVQHGAAARLVVAAIATVDAACARTAADYDARLIRAIYAERGAYVTRLAARLGGAAGDTLRTVASRRYPAECAAALAMLPPAAPPAGLAARPTASSA